MNNYQHVKHIPVIMAVEDSSERQRRQEQKKVQTRLQKTSKVDSAFDHESQLKFHLEVIESMETTNELKGSNILLNLPFGEPFRSYCDIFHFQMKMIS